MKTDKEIRETRKWYKDRWDLETNDVRSGKMKKAPKHGLGFYAGIVSALDWVLDYQTEEPYTIKVKTYKKYTKKIIPGTLLVMDRNGKVKPYNWRQYKK